MKLQDCIYRDVIRVKKNPAVPDIYDVELMHLDRLKQCDSVESIVSVIGAYFVGKELWDDIENLMIAISKDWRVRYLDRYYWFFLITSG
jgi:hypothetical protein